MELDKWLTRLIAVMSESKTRLMMVLPVFGAALEKVLCHVAYVIGVVVGFPLVACFVLMTLAQKIGSTNTIANLNKE
jgi:hypothetical protein